MCDFIFIYFIYLLVLFGLEKYQRMKNMEERIFQKNKLIEQQTQNRYDWQTMFRIINQKIKFEHKAKTDDSKRKELEECNSRMQMEREKQLRKKYALIKQKDDRVKVMLENKQDKMRRTMQIKTQAFLQTNLADQVRIDRDWCRSAEGKCGERRLKKSIRSMSRM